jgi:hypothetical protein
MTSSRGPLRGRPRRVGSEVGCACGGSCFRGAHSGPAGSVQKPCFPARSSDESRIPRRDSVDDRRSRRASALPQRVRQRIDAGHPRGAPGRAAAHPPGRGWRGPPRNSGAPPRESSIAKAGEGKIRLRRASLRPSPPMPVDFHRESRGWRGVRGPTGGWLNAFGITRNAHFFDGFTQQGTQALAAAMVAGRGARDLAAQPLVIRASGAMNVVRLLNRWRGSRMKQLCGSRCPSPAFRRGCRGLEGNPEGVNAEALNDG